MQGAITLAVLYLASAVAPPAAPPAWHTDLETALRLARLQDRPILVVFRCEH